MEVRNGAMVDLRESERVSRLSPLINDSQELADVLFSFLFTATHYHMQAAALEVCCVADVLCLFHFFLISVWGFSVHISKSCPAHVIVLSHCSRVKSSGMYY